VRAGSIGEGIRRQIPRQADAAGNDDIALGAGAAQPFAALLVMLSKFIRGFLLPDDVAQAGGLFIGLRFDGPPQLLS